MIGEADVDKKLVHRDDPGTSQDALRRVESSGGRLTHAIIVRNAVLAHPGRTSCELMTLTLLKQYQVRRRLTDLKNQKMITRSEESVRCSICGSNECVWRKATPGEQLELLI